MLFTFGGGGHTVRFTVDGDKQMFIASESTGQKFVALSKVFGEKAMKVLLARVQLIKSDEEMRTYVVQEFSKMGYKLIGFKNV